MAKSLQEQLLSAGLVKKNKAKALRKAQQNIQRGKVTSESEEAKNLAQQSVQEKVQRDKALNQKKNEQARQKAVLAQIKQLIQSNQVATKDGDIAYQFSDGKKIKKIYVNKLLQSQLVKGILAIVKMPLEQEPSYYLVPRAIAEKVAQRDAALVVTLNDATPAELADDDPYAEYKIPDDLMW